MKGKLNSDGIATVQFCCNKLEEAILWSGTMNVRWNWDEIVVRHEKADLSMSHCPFCGAKLDLDGLDRRDNKEEGRPF